MIEKIFEFLFGKKKNANTNKLILVVEDGDVERRFIEKILTKKGYRVICAKNGEDAIKLSFQHRPDLIFMDFAMPGGIDGKETCRRIKSESYAKDIPVVFLSASVSPTKVIDCYDAGAEYYLSKPINAGTLLEHTRILIEDAELIKKQAAQQNS